VPIQHSRSIPVRSTWHSLFLPHTFVAVNNAWVFFFRDSEVYVNPAWSLILAHCHFDIALLPPRPALYALPAICILFAFLPLRVLLFQVRFIIVREDLCLSELKWADFLVPGMWSNPPSWWFLLHPLASSILAMSLWFSRNHLLESVGPGTKSFLLLVVFLAQE